MNTQSAVPETAWSAGFFYNEPAEIYHRRTLGEANNTGLKILRDRSPAHYKAWVEGEMERADTKAFKLGRIVHAAILEYDRFQREYLLMPDFGPMQSSKNRAIRDAWLKDQAPGAIIVSPEQLTTAMNMREAVLRHKTARLIIENGKPEVTMRWTDPRTGIRCRARADWYCEEMGFMMDLKSTTDSSPDDFARAIAKYDYVSQHCFYASGAQTLGAPLDNYLICAVEKDAPHCVGVYHIDAAAEEKGFEKINSSLELLRKCVESNAWPAYGEDINVITVPGWYYSG